MYANDPIYLAIMLADRRAALQRAAGPSYLTPINAGRRRLRGLVVALGRRVRPAPRLSWQRDLDELRNTLLRLEATTTERLDPDADRVSVEMPLEQDQEALHLVSVSG